MDEIEHESKQRGLPLSEVLTDTSDRTRAAAAFVIAALAALAFVLVLDFSTVARAVLSLIVAVLTVALLVVAGWYARAWIGWGNPQLFLPSSADLRLGDHVTARFRRQARRGINPTDVAVTATLSVRESVGGGRLAGTPETTHSQVHDVEVRLTETRGGLVEADLLIEVPLDGLPTMELPGCEIAWLLEVVVAAGGAPDDAASFPVVVGAVVALDRGVLSGQEPSR